MHTFSIPVEKRSARGAVIESIGQYAAVLLGFFIPISTTLTTVCAFFILFSWWFGPAQSIKRRILWHPVMRWMYPFTAMTLFATLYSYGEGHALYHGLMTGVRFMMVPILMYFYQQKNWGRYALWAFTVAMLLTLLLAFGKIYAGLPIGTKFTMGAIFKSHIKTSFFMSMAALFLAYQYKYAQRYRIWLGMGIVLMVYYLLFMSAGRIGYLTLVTGLFLLAWQWYQRKGIVYAGGIALAMLLGAYCTSDIFSQRINILSQDLDFYQQGGRLLESSLGSRVAFALASIDLIKQHPLWGGGTGSYGAAYKKMHEKAPTLLTDNPHNEYLRVWVELGSVGFVLFLLLLYQQWRLSFQLPSFMRGFFQAVFLCFILGCFLNSWIKDYAEGGFYCFIVAVAFSLLPISEPQRNKTIFMH